MTLINTQVNRRSFLKVSAAGGAGMMIGFNWLVSCSTKDVKDVPKAWFDINAFIKIGDNGAITIYSPNPEIGQNVKTAMPLIVGEELDADWTMVTVEQASLDVVKYNRQIAGGSQSIRAGWDGLRMAGATGKQMLKQAAAKRWNVSIDDLRTEKGIITNILTGDKLGYGEVASEASTLDVPEKVELKEPKDYKLIGKRIQNVDGPKIIVGEPLFGLDFEREGMQIAMIVHPPAFGMKLKSLDDSAAKGMSGVNDVFVINSDPGEGRQWSDTNAFPELVVVTGNTTWQVMKAKKALKMEWEADGKLENSIDHVENLIDAVEKGKGNIAREDGSPDAIFKTADRVIERSYTAPFLAHNPMEPMNFFADVREDGAELVGPIQTPESLRKSVASLLDMPEDKITVAMTRMGGGFGRRLYGHFGVEAAKISQKIKAPVKLIYTREDDMTQGTYRPAYRITYKAAVDDQGELIAFAAKGAGIPGSPLFENRFPAGTVANYKAEKINVDTNISTGAWRAPRSNFVAGAEQAFIDEVAEFAGKDPIEFRVNLFEKAMANPVGKNNDYDAERYSGVLKKVKEVSGWGQEMPGVHRGVSAYYCHNSYVAQVVDVVLENNKPIIKKVWCAVDCGIVVNMEGALNQVEGGIIDGIGHAMYSSLTFENGTPGQRNFDKYRLIRNVEAPPEIETHFVINEIHPTGLGEPSLPPIIGALANALYKATGKRLYDQPFAQSNQEIFIG